MKRISVLTVLLCVGCFVPIDKKGADRFISEYYEACKDHDYSQIAKLYSEEFYLKISRDEWKKALKRVHSELGDLKSYEQISYGASSYFGIGNKKSGVYYSFLYRVKYANKRVEEMVNLFRAKGSNRYEITGHKIMKDGMIEPVVYNRSLRAEKKP